MLPNLKAFSFISGLALYDRKRLGKVQKAKSQVQIHQRKGNWPQHRLDWKSLQRGKIFLLSSSCCPLSPLARFFLLETSLQVHLQSDFWAASPSHPTWGTTYLLLFLPNTDYLAGIWLAPSFFPHQKSRVLCCVLFLWLLFILQWRLCHGLRNPRQFLVT